MSNTYNALIHAKQDGTGEEVANNKTGEDGSLYAPVTSIATPENGDSASKAYAVGEMFIRDGKLCTCIVAISSGDALVKDTNYKDGDVGSVLTELNKWSVDQTPGKSVTLNTASGGIWIVINSRDLLRVVPLPFITKNTNYTVNISPVSINNIGNSLQCSVVNKTTSNITLKYTHSDDISFPVTIDSGMSATITFA